MAQLLSEIWNPLSAVRLLTALFSLLCALNASATQVPAPGTEETTQNPGQAGEVAEPQADECDWKLEDQQFQEQTREVFRSWSCHSFRWFDGLWGDAHDFDEDAVRGWLIAGAEYTDYDGFDPRLRIRVRAPLPNMNQRWDLILGRVDETTYVSDTAAEDKTFFNPGVVNQRDEEPEWLLGLGHRGRARKKGWDWSAGVRLRVPPRPYAKLRYYYNKSFDQDTDFRFRQTFFWRSDDGLGTTSRGDFAHAFDASNVLRMEGIATISEESQGTQWYFGNTWYHRFEGTNGISLRAFITGETDHEVPLREYGFDLVWRRPFTRDWLYISLGPSVTWPKEVETEKREMSLGFGVWFEVEFGDWRY